ncbi:MAG: hypothetical protein QOD76_1600 [Solirubrobacteraceae bacterium]|nr:hypothetical protein [Solirubrobacteraceae bacterium]
MNSAPPVSVLIASQRDPQRLERCFAALARGAGAIEYEIVVLVNGPDDALRAFARRDEARARFVLAETNLGFAGAINCARRHARGRFLAIVHDDCLVSEGWLAPLLVGLERHPEAGLIASRIEVPDGRSFCGSVVFSDASFVIVPTAVAGTGLPIDGHSAASLMRTEAFDGAGGCDERHFPAGMVDTDLAMRMREAGWDVRCEPASGAEHALGRNASTGWRTWTGHRNIEAFRARWASRLSAHEPPGNRDAAAVQRALARAAARELPARVHGTPPPAGPEVDRAQATRLAALERDTLSAYVRAADRELEETRAALRASQAAHVRVHEEATLARMAFEARIAALESERQAKANGH